MKERIGVNSPGISICSSGSVDLYSFGEHLTSKSDNRKRARDPFATPLKFNDSGANHTGLLIFYIRRANYLLFRQLHLLTQFHVFSMLTF
jgi:hypothetical protein